MATFTAIKGRGKGSGAMGGVMQYVQQKRKRCGRVSSW